MVKNNIILLGILLILHSALGGLLHGDTYSALAAPSAVNYNYARIASYSSPLIANPVAATYSSRYTAYTAVPLTASYSTAAPVSRFHNAGLLRAFAAPPLQGHSNFYNPLVRQGVSAYAAVPIAGYRASFGNPLLRNYGASLRNFNAPLSAHDGLYPAPGFDSYADPLLTDQGSYGSFDSVGVDAQSVW